MQLMKQNHLNSQRWAYVKPLYTQLFNTLYTDIMPDTEILHGFSDGTKCGLNTTTLVNNTTKTLESYKHKALCKIMKKPLPAFCH